MAKTKGKNYKKRKNQMKNLIFFLILVIFNFAFAEQEGIEVIKSKSMKILSNIIRFAFSVLMLLGSALLIYLGIKYMMAKEKVEELHRSLLYLIVGIVLLITSFFIPNLIKNFIESSI